MFPLRQSPEWKTATGATVTDVEAITLHVHRGVNQSSFFSLLQDVEGFVLGDGFCDFAVIKHALFSRMQLNALREHVIAWVAQEVLMLLADAFTNTPGLRVLNHLLGHFVRMYFHFSTD
ncbi:MAG: hypothetical protein ACW992_05555 [Candidatus Thorarchaeota archaeon]